MVRERKWSMTVVVVGVAAALSAGLASASVPDAAGVIHGCYDAKGAVRVVDAGTGRACRRKETALAWSERGPKGDRGDTGPQGEAGPQGATGDPGYRVDGSGNRVYDNPTGEHMFTAPVHAPSVIARTIALPRQSQGVQTLSAPPGFAGHVLTATDAGAITLADPIADLGISRRNGALHVRAPNGVDLNGACTATTELVCTGDVRAAGAVFDRAHAGSCDLRSDGTTCGARLTAPEIATSGCTFGAAGTCADMSLGRATIGGCSLTSGAVSCAGTITGGTLKSAGCTFGTASSGTSCAGSFFINGTLQVTGGKLFTIDHPLDPKRKLLSHAAVESPALTNLYNGNVVTDRRGFAVVDLPRYFQALNRDFRYQLTVVGRTFAQAIVWHEIENNRFTIKTSQARVKVSWQVTGIRHDRYALEHPLRVERAKPASLRGRTFYR
jgi:hypothetical protein